MLLPIPSPPMLSTHSQTYDLFFNYYCYIYICAYIHINIHLYAYGCLYNLLSSFNVAHMCIYLELSTWGWRNHQESHTWRKTSSFISHWFFVCSSLSWGEALWDFFCPHCMFLKWDFFQFIHIRISCFACTLNWSVPLTECTPWNLSDLHCHTHWFCSLQKLVSIVFSLVLFTCVGSICFWRSLERWFVSTNISLAPVNRAHFLPGMKPLMGSPTPSGQP